MEDFILAQMDMVTDSDLGYNEETEKLEKKIKLVKQYDFDRVGRYELLDILKEVVE